MVSINDRVCVGQTQGTVRFVGLTRFSSGIWVGIELDTPTGKNDGSVQGERYFDCKENYGVFVRPSTLKFVSQENERELFVDNENKNYEKRRSTSSSPQKMNVFHSPRSAATISRIPCIQTPKMQRKTLNMMSSFETLIPSRKIRTPDSLNEVSLQPSQSTTPTRGSPTKYEDCQEILENDEQKVEEIKSFQKKNDKKMLLDSLEDEKASAQFYLAKFEASGIETENELKKKLKVFDMKRIEDKNKIKQLEDRLQENDFLEKAENRLQTKITSMQQEIEKLKMSLKNMENEKTELETKLSEALEMLETATLDKEMAEEKAEILNSELDFFKNELQKNNIDNKFDDTFKEGKQSEDNEESLKEQNVLLKDALINWKLRDLKNTNYNVKL
ncbi:hypothetical protein PORY_001598 [Pneumocystis oryctolagi]|uniref:Uncharacterized protein n=1 Tax=Pneumocystis oryctolagi TaxID=42067 RepID=A0ACB7CD89_9ASCO|nr:hypothetical protein PORY_001598 [Pneumocystis oryctolagi]